MNIPVIDSIINGNLNPELIGEIEFVKISRALSYLPATLKESEKLLHEQISQYVRFDFDAERPFILGKGIDRFAAVPDYKIPINTDLSQSRPANPKEKFYAEVVKAEEHRLLLALTDFANTAAVTDSKGEVKNTLRNIYHLSKQLKPFQSDNVIMYRVKQSAFSLYYKVAYTFEYIIGAKFYEPVEDYYYELFGKYPDDDTLAIFTAAHDTALSQSDVPDEDPIDAIPSKPKIDEGVQRIITREEEFRKAVSQLNFLSIPAVAVLSPNNQSRLIQNITGNGVPYGVAMLVHLEYDKYLKRIYKFNKTNIYKHWAECLKSNDRTIRGNYNCLTNPKTTEDRSNYTSEQHIKDVKAYYDSLLQSPDNQ